MYDLPALLPELPGQIRESVFPATRDDKPDVILETPADSHRVSSFMNICVADIDHVYEEWSAKGAEFLTPPLDNGGNERRCYLRDPDGRIIEVGQLSAMLDLFTAFDIDPKWT